MLRRPLLALALLVACASPQVRPPPPPLRPTDPAAQLDARWAPFQPLLGVWDAASSDPGKPSTGRFTLAPELGGQILVRHSTNDSTEGHHEDLMVISDPAHASYFDNEGHTIRYTISTSASGSVVFLSDEVPGAPRFRLTYQVAGDHGTVQFEIAPPGSAEFHPYVGGTFTRSK